MIYLMSYICNCYVSNLQVVHLLMNQMAALGHSRMHVNCMCETLQSHTCNILHAFSKPPFYCRSILLVAGIAQTSLMFNYQTCLPAVSLEPTTVSQGYTRSYAVQNLSVEPTELPGSGSHKTGFGSFVLQAKYISVPEAKYLPFFIIKKGWVG